MSKAQKIISMLLAIAMVLTVAPVSGIASAAVSNYSYGNLSFSKTDFTVDTSATTKVIRVGTPGTFSYGTTVVKATRSGIPEHTGKFSALAYAGETPEYPKVVFTIKGVKPTETPTFESDSGLGWGATTVSEDDATKTYTYTKEVTSGTLSAGTQVTYTITYKVGTNSYTTTAYAYTENILRQNGVNLYRIKKSWGSVKSRMSALFLIQGANMYSGWHADGGENRGYINFAADAPLDGGALAGLGSDEGFSSNAGAFAVADNSTGTVKKFHRQNSSGGYDTDERFGYGNDKNRPESTVYLDKRSGSGSETIRDVNMRLTHSYAEEGSFARGNLEILGTYGEQIATNNKTTPANTTISQWTVDWSKYKTLTNSNVGVTSSSFGDGDYNLLPFGGTGPEYGATSSDTFGWSFGFYVTGYPNSSGDDNWIGSSAFMNVTFKVYDTTDLWNVYNGVRNGDGSTYTTTRLGYTADTAASANQSVTFNKGQNPQEASYSASSWYDFSAAYNAAGKILAKPNTNQTEVNAATRALITAYNNLSGFNANVSFEIKHVISGTNTELIPSQTTAADGSTTKPAGTVMSHSAATIEGYTVVGNAQGTTLLSGQNAKEVVTYSYQVNSYTVRAMTNNDSSDVSVRNVKYGDSFALSTFDDEIGTKAGYVFDGWYYDSGTWAQPVPTSFTIPASNVVIYAKWNLAPITLTVDVSAAGKDPVKAAEQTPATLGGEVSFTKPAFTDIEGYVFVDYYTDSTYSTKVTWPLTVTENTTIYARLDDVNGKITFDSNGGTAVSTITYTSGVPFNAPADPTRTGYAFKGWYRDAACTNKVLADDGTIWKNGKALTMSTMTGFVAYAGWEAQQVTITFDPNIPSSEKSSFNTTAGSIQPLTGYADTEFPEGYSQPIPRRLGYEFAYWAYRDDAGRWYEFKFDSYPTTDLTLKAQWKDSDYSAFIDITAYQKLLGEDVEVTTARRGDIVTFKMTSQTNFYTGSSVFVFMYDNRFFEPYKQGTDAFVLNPENDYISGIYADHYGVTNNSAFASRWPSGLDSVNYNAMMITIDPDVSKSTTTAPMKDGTWMLEFKLVIKDSASGSGKVYMDNAWTRTTENVLGTMFYGWTQNATSVFNTYNNVVIPNLDDATATIVLDESEAATTSVTVKTNVADAKFEDGSTEKTFTGRAGQEIMDYVSPTYAGYELTSWVGETDSSKTWIEGFYLPEGETETTYVAQWTPVNYTVNFYKHEDSEAAWKSLTVAYNSEISKPAGNCVETGYTLEGWYYIDGNGNHVDVEIPGMLCPVGGVNLYAKWTPAQVNYKIKAIYTDVDTGEVTEAYSSAKKALTGSYIDIVTEMPATELENHNYIEISELPKVNTKYMFDADDSRNYPLPTNVEVLADGSTEITLYYTVAKYTITFSTGDNGKFADGTTEKVVANVPHGTLVSTIAPASTEIVPNEGYEFSKWQGVSDSTSASRDRTYNATFTAKKFDIIFDANGGAFSGGATQSTKSVAYNANISAPAAPTKAGYSFIGWSTDKNATTGSTSLGTLTTVTPPTYYAIYSAIDYSVIYMVGSETLYTDGPYHIDDTVTVRAAESKEGYDFDGWYYNGVKVTTLTIETANVTLVGAFTAKKYDVVFYNNDGTDASTKVPVAYGSEITAPSAPTRNGYTFKGWAAASTATADEVISDFGTLASTAPAPYYAVWEANEVSYYVDIYKQDVNGEYPAAADTTITLTGKVGTVTSEYVPAEYEGFTFDSSASVLSGTVTPTEDGALRLTVKYTRNKYNLVTIVDGAQTGSTEYYYGATVTAPADAQKTGYTFNGWTPSVPETMPIPANGTSYELTASFTVNSYKVSYYRDESDTSLISSASSNFGTVITPITVSKEGYTLLGWAYKGTTDVLDFSDAENPITVKAQDNNFVAVWQVNKYKLTYSPGVTGIESTTYDVEYGTPKASFPVAPAPVRTGYTFGGWNLSSAPDTMPARTYTIRGTWTINNYTISFTNTGDSTVEPIEAKYGDAIYAPEDPVKEGYTFLGWYEQGSDEKYEFPETMPAITDEDGGVLVLEGKWQVNSYTIIFKADGAEHKTITQDYGTDITEPDAPVKTGYSFAGWDTEVPATMPVTPEGGLVINAKWTVNSYKITFKPENGEADFDKTYAYGAQTAAPAEPTKTGYTFDGWYLGDSKYEFAAMPAENVTLTAHWNINSYKITFNSDGGTTVPEATYAYNATVTAPTEPTKTGYTFDGWYLGNNKYEFTTMPAENITLIAHWNINSYKITFNSDGGTTVPEATYAYNATVTAPTAPTKEGYTFGGWTPALPETMPAENLEVKAVWNVNEYTITFDVNGGDKDVEAITQDYGTTVAAPEAPTKTGYTFDGWYLGDEKYEFSTMPAKSITLKAMWTINQYTIRFDINGGDEAVEAITRDYNAPVTAPATPVKTGYTFDGWYLGNNKYEFTTMPAENITLIAHWNINSYKITFLNANGAEFSSDVVEYNSEIVAPEGTPDKTYYIFVGWSLDGETVPEEGLGTMPANELIVYPVYERVTVTLATSDESTAVIDKTNAKPPVTGYIYGLNERLTEDALRGALAVVGDGKLEITKVGDFKYLGTGTMIEVIDNVTNETVEIYYVIIFGDVNGDSIVNASDASIINREAVGGTSWSTEGSETYDYCKIFAADADKNGSITTDDYTLVAKASMRVAAINQVTGEFALNA